MTEHVNFFLNIRNYIPVFISVVLIYHYYRYKILDYLIFAAVFITTFFSILFTHLADIQETAFNYQATFLFVTIHYILLLIHCHRINETDLNTPRFALEMTWAVLIILAISQWEVMLQPETSSFFFFEFSRGSSLYFPKGAGAYFFNGQILISTAHSNFIYLFWTYAVGITTYTYATIDLSIKDTTTILVKYMWAISFFFGFLWALSLNSFFYVGEWTNNLITISFLLEAIIAIKYSEALLLSHTQITRAGKMVDDLYKEVDDEYPVSEYGANLVGVTQYLSKLSYEEALQVFPDQKETPVAINILSKSSVLSSFSFDPEVKNNYLVGNLISAIISFSEEILSNGSESKYFRFQTENLNIVASKLDRVIVSYVFRGFAPLAEIRLGNFIEAQKKNKEMWDIITGNLSRDIPFMSSEQQKVVKKTITEYFGPIFDEENPGDPTHI